MIAYPLSALSKLPGPLDSIWDTILELAQLPVGSRALIGGQMVVLHGLSRGRRPPRITRHVDILANLVVSRTGLRDCVRAVTEMGFTPQEAADRDLLHRFIRADDQGIIDVFRHICANLGMRRRSEHGAR